METHAVHTPVHTPGPWQWNDHCLQPVDPDPEQYAVHTILDVEYLGWGFASSDPDQTNAETHANLALIAAAPQLLDAARAAEAVLARQGWLASSTDPEAVAIGKLRAAIATATTLERA